MQRRMRLAWCSYMETHGTEVFGEEIYVEAGRRSTSRHVSGRGGSGASAIALHNNFR